jgi:hypothetical protein
VVRGIVLAATRRRRPADAVGAIRIVAGALDRAVANRAEVGVVNVAVQQVGDAATTGLHLVRLQTVNADTALLGAAVPALGTA